MDNNLVKTNGNVDWLNFKTACGNINYSSEINQIYPFSKS